ncbi:MAG TPA: hypothetical protein VFS09_00485 [Candidatus Eisenbacteria bacterium]|nr:hypothetical protein [Candidatus Eisenbacteria bacterium]
MAARHADLETDAVALADDPAWTPMLLAEQPPTDAGAQPGAPVAGTTSAPAGKPLPGKRTVLLYSLLLPGTGELALGAGGRGAAFLVAEGLIWAHYVYYEVAGGMRRDDYIEQAQLNAGVGVSSADDSYWKLLGQYERSSGPGPGSYEEDLRREARDIYPDDPAAQDAYVVEHLPSGDEAWAWSSPELQGTYKDTRASSNHAYDRAKYSFAAAILNRLVSAIDTQILHNRLTKDGQARLDEGTRIVADATPQGGTRVLLRRRF